MNIGAKPHDYRLARAYLIAEILSKPLRDELIDGKQIKELAFFGFLRQATLRHKFIPNETLPWIDNSKKKLYIHEQGYQLEYVNGSGMKYPLDVPKTSDIIEGYVFFIRARQPSQGPFASLARIECLLLQKTPLADTFQRIGTLEVGGNLAIALRYKVRQSASDKQGMWRNFTESLRERGSIEGRLKALRLNELEEREFQEREANAIESETKRIEIRDTIDESNGNDPDAKLVIVEAGDTTSLYDFCWDIGDFDIEKLTPEMIVIN